MTLATDDLSLTLENLLRTVPGVTTVYRAGPLPAVIASELIASITPIPAPRLVSIDTGETRTTVTALIGVDADIPAQQTGRAAHERLTEYLGAGLPGPTFVTVRIGMVS